MRICIGRIHRDGLSVKFFRLQVLTNISPLSVNFTQQKQRPVKESALEKQTGQDMLQRLVTSTIAIKGLDWPATNWPKRGPFSVHAFCADIPSLSYIFELLGLLNFKSTH